MNPTSFVYICQVPNLINYNLSYHHLVTIDSLSIMISTVIDNSFLSVRRMNKHLSCDGFGNLWTSIMSQQESSQFEIGLVVYYSGYFADFRILRKCAYCYTCADTGIHEYAFRLPLAFYISLGHLTLYFYSMLFHTPLVGVNKGTTAICALSLPRD